MPQNNLNLNRVVLITGASKRIGAAIANLLHAQQWNIILHYHHSTDAALNLVHSLNQQRENSAYAIQADLTNFDYYPELITHAVQRWERLDALVNNAATFFPTPIAAATTQEWHTLFDTNVKSPFFLTQAALPYLREHNGNIVNITDTHADGRPLKQYSIYNMTKAALLMQTQSLARDLAPNIRVNAVAPGVSIWEDTVTDLQQEILQRTPLKRAGTAEETAKAVRYLLEDATYTTGSVVYVDGGRCVFN